MWDIYKFSISDGVTNADSISVSNLENNCVLAIISDGAGSNSKRIAKQASESAVNFLEKKIKKNDLSNFDLENIFLEAEMEVVKQTSQGACTASLVLVDENIVKAVCIGDSSVFAINSLNEWMDLSLLAPRKPLMGQGMAMPSIDTMDRPNAVLLASDGLYLSLDISQILNLVFASANFEYELKKLLDEKYKGKLIDDISVILIRKKLGK